MNGYRQLDDIQKHWTPPAGLRHSTPRQVEFSATGVFLAVLGVALVVGAVVGAALLANESRRQEIRAQAIRTEGREVDARVVRLWQRKGENNRRFLEYQFEVDGRIYRKKTRVQTAYWKTLKDGGLVRITFLPSDPEQNELYDRPIRILPLWVAIAAAVFGLALAACIALSLRRARELLQDGRVAPGVVTRVQKIRTHHGASSTVIHYDFPLLTGAVAHGKANCGRRGLEAGSVINIVYDPNRVERSAIYPMQLVRERKEL